MTETVPIDDRGFSLGVGLFETVLAVDGALQLWEAHVARLQRGCVNLALPPPGAGQLAEAAQAALDGGGLQVGRAAVRLTWTGGGGARGLATPSPVRPRLVATAAKASDPPGSIALAVSEICRSSTSPISRLKTLSYLDNVEARRRAVEVGADEALLLNEHGEMTSCAAANLFWFEAGQLCTPALACGVLDGVVRGLALAMAPKWGWAAEEVRSPPARLGQSRGAFVTNSLMGGVEVRSLDAVPLPRLDGSHLQFISELSRSAGRE